MLSGFCWRKRRKNKSIVVGPQDGPLVSQMEDQSKYQQNKIYRLPQRKKSQPKHSSPHLQQTQTRAWPTSSLPWTHARPLSSLSKARWSCCKPMHPPHQHAQAHPRPGLGRLDQAHPPVLQGAHQAHHRLRAVCHYHDEQASTTPTREAAAGRRPNHHSLNDEHLHRDNVRKGRAAPDTQPCLKYLTKAVTTNNIANETVNNYLRNGIKDDGAYWKRNNRPTLLRLLSAEP